MANIIITTSQYNDIKAYAADLQETNVITGLGGVIHAYEQGNLDDYDLYNLSRSIIMLLNNIEALRSTIDKIKV